MPVDVLAPPLGTNVDTVVLRTWYKQEGETVRAGEPLFAVETDKAMLDIEAPASGILRQVSCQPGTEVKTLSRLAVIVAPDEMMENPKGDSPRESAKGVSPEREPTGQRSGWRTWRASARGRTSKPKA